MGRPMTPKRRRWTPGFAALMPGTEPPTDTASIAPSAMCAPDRNDSGMSLAMGVAALPAPSATAAS